MGIISNFISLIEPITLMVNFSCLIIVFIGCLYVAIHARNIPIWFRTPLWYIGLSSFLICMSIICEWTIGSSLFFSYSNFGLFAETLLNVNLAICSGLMFANTLYNDVRCMKMRKNQHKDIAIK